MMEKSTISIKAREITLIEDVLDKVKAMSNCKLDAEKVSELNK